MSEALQAFLQQGTHCFQVFDVGKYTHRGRMTGCLAREDTSLQGLAFELLHVQVRTQKSLAICHSCKTYQVVGLLLVLRVACISNQSPVATCLLLQDMRQHTFGIIP